jgi:predicted unusual protein kinase regulating ubiquinone biosynthesis (AarF/ABC1/UbiB family)
MRGVMMKMAQIVSFSGINLPPEAQNSLIQLQANAPPAPYAAIKEVIRQELGNDPQLIFRRFDKAPMAAASIGQVHRAELPSGEQVVVKVQYPHVDEVILGDLKNLRIFFKLFERNFQGRVDGNAMADEFGARISEELDYTREAQNQKDFAKIFKDHPTIRVPEIYDEFSTKRVLTQSFDDGTRFYDYVKLDQRHPRNDAAARIMNEFVGRSIQIHGMFNADPHPGNYLFHDNGNVTFLDFGCVKRWSPQSASAFRYFMAGLLQKNDDKMLAALRRLSVANGNGDYTEFIRMWKERAPDVREPGPFLYVPEAFPTDEPDPKLFNNINLPADLLYLFRIVVGLGIILVRMRACFDNWEMNKSWIVEADQLYSENAWNS